MNKIFKAFAAAGVIFAAASCEDQLNTVSESQVTTDAIFDNAENANKAVIGIYHSLFEERAYRNTLVGVMMSNTDAEVNADTGKKAGDAGMVDIAMYNFSSSLSGNGMNAANAGDPWSRIYKAVENCNQAIKGIRKYNTGGDAELNYLLGEALTLRAFLYHDLIKIWGDVPARFEPVTNSTIYAGKSDRREIYTQILADLETAESLVPWAGGNSYTQKVERVNKEFVKGLRARIALFAAGKTLLNQGDMGTLGYLYDDENRRRELYRIVKDETDQILASTSCRLAGSYEEIFRQQCQGVISTGRESIFELPASASRGEMLSYVGHKRSVPTSGNNDEYCQSSVYGRILMVPSFFYSYEVGDKRRDVSAKTYYYNNGEPKMASDASTFYLSKWRAEWMSEKMYSKDDGVNFMVMRLADIYLMNAEANNYLGNMSDAKSSIIRVRERAFEDSSLAAQGVDQLSSQDEILSFIQKERAREFIGEGVRRWDLMRWGNLKETLDKAHQDMIELRTTTEFPLSIYYKKNADNGYDVWGLNPGESESPGSGWTKKTWIKSSCFANYVGKLYNTENAADTHIRQTMPVMSVVISNSNGLLSNDYGYSN